jgi:hypothetical protein
MNQILLLSIPKRYENYLNILGFRVYNVFFSKREKVKIFRRKKHSFCRELFFEIQYPGRGGVEARQKTLTIPPKN